MRTAPAALIASLVLLTGCAEARETASTAKDCAALANDVAQSGLDRAPTQQEAQAAVRRLDDRIQKLDSPKVKDAATDLRDQLRALEQAARSGNAADARKAGDQARAAARKTAETCGLPADQFLRS